jgi:ATP-binding cassette, subfamily B, bacterial
MQMSDSRKLQKAFFDLEAWRYFSKFIRGRYRQIVLNATTSAAQSLIVIPSLLLIRYAFDYAIPLKYIHILVLIGVCLFTLRLANSGISLWLSARNIDIIRTVIFQLREDLLLKLYTFSRRFHTTIDRNIVHARIVQDTERLSNVSNSIISRLIPALFTSCALCVILLFFNWFLFLVMISIFPALFLSNRLTGKLVKKRVYVFQRAFEKFSKGMLFVLRYMDLTRIQTAEQPEISRQTLNLTELRDTTGRMAFIYAVHGQVQSVTLGMAGVVIMVIGGIAVANKAMTVGEFLAFYVAAGYLNGHVSSIVSSVADIIAGNESLVTLHGIAEASDINPYRGRNRLQFKGMLSLEDVHFKYGNLPVLENINLHIKPDSNIAIIGPNGAGKSTIIQLILGFYRPRSGQLCADNVPYDELDITDFRRYIGVVMQNPPVFSGTIIENIVYGAHDVSREEIVYASRCALADDFIRQLPEGYDTQVGEDGVRLSGGECQRLAIARALVRRPKLLILDEPTNHLDQNAIGKVMQNLINLKDRPAVLLISHDKSVIAHAGEVYQLRKGILKPYLPAPSATIKSQVQ